MTLFRIGFQILNNNVFKLHWIYSASNTKLRPVALNQTNVCQVQINQSRDISNAETLTHRVRYIVTIVIQSLAVKITLHGSSGISLKTSQPSQN